QFVVRYLRRPQFVSLIIRAYYRCGPDLCNKAISIDKLIKIKYIEIVHIPPWEAPVISPLQSV
ncbi:hypothetical protein HNP33_004250, partial [Comamonas odontotermitis]